MVNLTIVGRFFLGPKAVQGGIKTLTKPPSYGRNTEEKTLMAVEIKWGSPKSWKCWAPFYRYGLWSENECCSVVSSYFQPMDCVAHQAPLSTEFSSKNTGVGCHALLQGISPPRVWTHVSCITGRFFFFFPFIFISWRLITLQADCLSHQGSKSLILVYLQVLICEEGGSNSAWWVVCV